MASFFSSFSGFALVSLIPEQAGPPPPANTNITSAVIEDNGWVLRLTGTFSAGTFSDYVMSPNVNPRVVVRSSHPGFVQSAGTAVSGTMSRTLVGTIPLRLAVNLSSPLVQVIDEADIGGGQRRVRIALSEHIYATDTNLTLDVLAGWRTGEGAATGIAVTNNSTVAAPLPIFRWAWFNGDVASGTFRLSLIVASHHPVGFQPVAGVKFTVTDGTRTKEVWATALGTDTRGGDNLRCYTVEIDPASSPAFTEGRLRCDAEVYPWLGSMRTTDPAGTRSMDIIAAQRTTTATRPLLVGYDPTGGRYRNQWVVCDPVNGTTTAAAGMVQADLAAAKAVPGDSKPRDAYTAFQALFLANKTLPAANGGTSSTRACDGASVVIPAGVTEVGAFSITAGLSTSEIPMRVIGDPDDPDPRTNCILRTPNSATAPPATRFSQMHFANVRLEIGQRTFVVGPVYYSLNNVEVRGKAGFETSNNTLHSTSPLTGNYTMDAVNVRWWRTGPNAGMSIAQHRFGLIRFCEFSRAARAYAVLTSRFIEHLDTTLTPGGSAVGGFNVPADLGGSEDNIIAYNDLRHVQNRVLLFTPAASVAAATEFNSLRRLVVMGNLAENFTSTQPMFSVGEGSASVISYTIFENNTFVGERCNFFYNDPPNAVDNSKIFVNRVVGNVFDWNPTKHDDINDATFGYRPHLTGGWSALSGVMMADNYDAGRHPSVPSFQYYFVGLRTVRNLSAVNPLYTDDRSRFGANTGGGDYRPAAGSPLIGRMTGGNTDRDLQNNPRVVGSAVGALEAV